MWGVPFEGSNGGEDRGLAEEVLIRGEFDNRWAFAFSNRVPNLLSVKLDEEVLVRVDRWWVLNAQRRKIWVKRARSNRGKGRSFLLVAQRRRWRRRDLGQGAWSRTWRLVLNTWQRRSREQGLRRGRADVV
jgi:hypothetical protein